MVCDRVRVRARIICGRRVAPFALNLWIEMDGDGDFPLATKPGLASRNDVQRGARTERLKDVRLLYVYRGLTGVSC